MFLKSQKFYQAIIGSVFLFSCASRGPGYAAREELYEKLSQSETPLKREPAVKDLKSESLLGSVPESLVDSYSASISSEEENLSPQMEMVQTPVPENLIPKALSSTNEEVPRAISSQEVAPKKNLSTKVIVDDLELQVVPSTSSTSGKGFLLSE